jgi:hypothetical protein
MNEQFIKDSSFILSPLLPSTSADGPSELKDGQSNKFSIDINWLGERMS